MSPATSSKAVAAATGGGVQIRPARCKRLFVAECSIVTYYAVSRPDDTMWVLRCVIPAGSYHFVVAVWREGKAESVHNENEYSLFDCYLFARRLRVFAAGASGSPAAGRRLPQLHHGRRAKCPF